MVASLAIAAVAGSLGPGCRRSQSRDEPDRGPHTAADDTPTADDATPARPRLVILIVIDQLASWSFERDAALLDGGIARLMREGVYYREAAFPYAITYTAPGHATLGTGAPPSVSGILANQWYRRAEGAQRGSGDDPDSPVFQLIGAGEQSGQKTPESTGDQPSKPSPSPSARSKSTRSDRGLSGKQLRVPGIADALREATGGAGHSVSISVKARGAIFALGQRPDRVVWYDADQPAMTTSRYYASEPPAWLIALAAERPIAPRLDYVWKPADADRLREVTGIADAADGEGGEYGLTTAFPHDLSQTQKPAKALRATPLADELVLEAARAAIAGEELGADDVPDLLSLSFSAHDYAGHYWGQESWERLELLLRLDDAIGEFLAELDAQIGADHYAVVLTSDHGATPLIERSRAAKLPAFRTRTAAVVAAAKRAAAKVLGPGDWVADSSASTVYMSAAFDAQPQEARARALDAVVAAVAGMDGIGYAALTAQIAGGCERRTGLEQLACYSVIPGESGDVFFTPAAHSLVTTTYMTGTSHGSPNDEDRVVPIVVRAPGRAHRVVNERVSPLQVAPTLAELLGIQPPAGATAQPLR